MFFPVLMVRDFGPWGWIAFIIPNCLGAMFVGLIHRRPGAADAVIRAHAPAASAFGTVTILFHVAFLAWFLPTILAPRAVDAPDALLLALGVVALAIAAGGAFTRTRLWLACAAVVFALSIACAVLAALTGTSFPAAPNQPGRFGLMALAYLAPTIALGFLTCPHLDLTFLRVRRELPGRPGSLAFILGFALFFPALMVMTLLYAVPMARGAACLYIVAHIIIQAWFTMSAHFRELRELSGAGRRTPSPALLILIALAAAIAYFIRAAPPIAGVPATEALYKFFILFYGIVFPAYIWTAMIPRRPSRIPRARIMWAAVGIALPFAWFGYMLEIWPMMLAIPLVILAAPLAGRLAPATPAGSGK